MKIFTDDEKALNLALVLIEKNLPISPPSKKK
jgi:hypothetical protein